MRRLIRWNWDGAKWAPAKAPAAPTPTTPATPTAPPLIQLSETPQRTYSTLAEAVTDLGMPDPATTKYTMWDPTWTTINQAHDAMRASGGKILVLPDARDYPVDLSRGFGAPSGSVTAVDGWPTYYPNNTAWFATTRGLQGIVGLNAGARITFTNTGNWSAPQQGMSIADATEAGDASKAWSYTKPDGTRTAFSSAGMSVIQFDSTDGWLANVTMGEGLDLGGIAYSAVNFAASSGVQKATVKRVTAKGSWYGFAGVPNGETGAVTFNVETPLIEDCWFDGARSDGVEYGTSPVMINNSTGSIWRRVLAKGVNRGMPTIWKSSGYHLLEDVYIYDTPSQALNLEMMATGARVELRRGFLEAGDQQTSGMHVGVGGYAGDIDVTTYGTRFGGDRAWDPSAMCVQIYGDGVNQYQHKSRLRAFVDEAGTLAYPVRVSGGLD